MQEIARPCLEKYNSIRYWAQDESRFGLKTRVRRRITRRGVKPRVSVQWPFKAFYTYGIVEPLTGEVMIRPFERVNALCFQQFLNDFASQYPDDFHVVQVDNARSHCANTLVMPDNVMILYQPPYSPEVNAAERLWQWSKGETANQIFADLETLKETVKSLFLSKPKQFFASLTAKSFIFDALRKVGVLPNSA